jgi:hypothetical protein
MPLKKAKKSKPAKPSKPNKSAKSGTSALKKAAKVVAKKVSAALSKKPIAKPAKTAAKAGKNKPLGKKALQVKSKSLKTAPAAKDKKNLEKPKLEKAKLVATEKAKGKVSAKAEAASASVKGKGKKGADVVLELPAPKGVALLGREGKKKAKAAELQAALKRRCREPGCEHDFTINGYCRLHYIKNWRKIKRKEAIIASGQLNNYVEELVSKYPDKYLDVIRQDLASEKDWVKVVVDLELESSEEEASGDEEADSAVEGVRGGSRGDFDDDSDSF